MNGQALGKTVAAVIMGMALAVPAAQAGNGPSQPLSDVNLSRTDVIAQRQWEPLLRFAHAQPAPISGVQLSRGGGGVPLAPVASLPDGSSGFSWTAALIGAGAAFALMLISATATLGFRSRRRVAAL